MSKSALFTIGYEGRQLDEVIAQLLASRVEIVIDIRELPLSRRRGFSKTPLGDALRAEGIEYVHMREAGNPYRKDNDQSSILAKYAEYIAHADEVVEHVADTARGRRAALLCYEAEPHECHRSRLAPHVAKLLRCKVTDL